MAQGDPRGPLAELERIGDRRLIDQERQRLARIPKVYLAPPLIQATYPCPCCRYPTLAEPPPGTYGICPVCFWEDDLTQSLDPTYRGGANEESLAEARASFDAIGASNPLFVANVRPPTPDEIRRRVRR